LIRAALALARSHHVKQVYLLTETAEGFFSRLGFEPVDRATVDSAVQQSVEFTTACPSSAVAMMLKIGG
jgi:amino-acid N-acetyltransferase